MASSPNVPSNSDSMLSVPTPAGAPPSSPEGGATAGERDPLMPPNIVSEMLVDEGRNVAFATRADEAVGMGLSETYVNDPQRVGSRIANALPQGIVRDLGTTRIEQAFYTMSWAQLVQHRNALNTRLKDLAIETHNMRAEYNMINTVMGFRMMTELANRQTQQQAVAKAAAVTGMTAQVVEATTEGDLNRIESALIAQCAERAAMPGTESAATVASPTMAPPPGSRPGTSPTGEMDGFALPDSAIAGSGINDPSGMGYGNTPVPGVAPYERNVRANPPLVSQSPKPKPLAPTGAAWVRDSAGKWGVEPVNIAQASSIHPVLHNQQVASDNFCRVMGAMVPPPPPPAAPRNPRLNKAGVLSPRTHEEGGGSMRRVPSPTPSVATEATVEERVMFAGSGPQPFTPAEIEAAAYAAVRGELPPIPAELIAKAGTNTLTSMTCDESRAMANAQLIAAGGASEMPQLSGPAAPSGNAGQSVDMLGIRHPNIGSTPVQSTGNASSRRRSKSPRGRRGLDGQGRVINLKAEEISFLQSLQDELETLISALDIQGHVHPSELPVRYVTKCVHGIPTDLAEEVFLPFLLTLGGLLKPRNLAIAGICLSYEGEPMCFNGRMFIKFRNVDIADCYVQWLNGVDCFGGRIAVPEYRESRDIDYLGHRTNGALIHLSRFGEAIWQFWPATASQRTRATFNLPAIDWQGTSPIEFAREV